MPVIRVTHLIAALLFLNQAIQAADPPVSFQKDIAPLLVDKCAGCHNADKAEGKYSLATYTLLLKGGEKGKAIEPGKPEESRLSRMCHGAEKPAMPFEDDKLPDDELAKLDNWIREGAKFDGPNVDVPLEEMIATASHVPMNRDSDTPAPISALAFRPDGNLLAVAGYYQITFWEPTTGKFVGRWPTDIEQINDLCYTPDGKNLIHAGGTPGKKGEVVVWDAENGKPIRKLIETKDAIFAVAVRPGAREVAAGGADRIFRVWEIDTGKELYAVENHADWILDLAYSPDGKKLLTASRDRSAKIWDQTTAEPLLTFAQHTDAVYAVGSNPEGTIACSIGADKQLRFWQMEGNGDQKSALNAHQETACRLLFAPSGKMVVTVGNDKRVVAWNPADGKVIREFNGHQDVVYSVALNSDEKKLATGSWDGEVRLWNIENGELITHFIAIPAKPTPSSPAP